MKQYNDEKSISASRNFDKNSDSKNFYQNLAALKDFQNLPEHRYYSKIPKDWFIVVSDIKGSTVAIQNGRYRDINTLGAASIAVVQSATPEREIPSVFGGDGASFLVPPEDLPALKSALLNLKAHSLNQYGLELRVGGIEVSEVRSAGLDVEIAKFDLGKGKTIPLIRGGGMAFADDKIKQPNSTYEWSLNSQTLPPKLETLSCRWQPLPSTRGQILTLLIKANSSSYTVYEEVLSELTKILGDNWELSNPVKQKIMKYKSFKNILLDEWKLQKIWPLNVFFKKLLSIIISILMFSWKIPMPFNTKKYLEEMKSHSDYRKFDDMLRLVLDCTQSEIDQIKSMLDRLYNEGVLFYGTHASDHALMTCLVESLNTSGHIHFIDGSDGGYAVAAIGLKKQISSKLN